MSIDHLNALTMQIDIADAMVEIVKTPSAKKHFRHVAKQLRKERDAVLGPIGADIEAMTADELLAELTA